MPEIQGIPKLLAHFNPLKSPKWADLPDIKKNSNKGWCIRGIIFITTEFRACGIWLKETGACAGVAEVHASHSPASSGWSLVRYRRLGRRRHRAGGVGVHRRPARKRSAPAAVCVPPERRTMSNCDRVWPFIRTLLTTRLETVDVRRGEPGQTTTEKNNARERWTELGVRLRENVPTGWLTARVAPSRMTYPSSVRWVKCLSVTTLKIDNAIGKFF